MATPHRLEQQQWQVLERLAILDFQDHTQVGLAESHQVVVQLPNILGAMYEGIADDVSMLNDELLILDIRIGQRW
jgi:hypothetical protein